MIARPAVHSITLRSEDEDVARAVDQQYGRKCHHRRGFRPN
jgi:hypothetical protein